jgi:hypothetical protein
MVGIENILFILSLFIYIFKISFSHLSDEEEERGGGEQDNGERKTKA